MKHWMPAFIGVVVLAVGAGSMSMLLFAKKPMAEASTEVKEKPILVEILEAEVDRYPVTLDGHGEIRPVRETRIAAEIPGQIVSVHTSLEVGQSVAAGTTLFTIDPQLYEMAVNEARASVAQGEAALRRLAAEREHTQQRLNTLDRRSGLSRSQRDRAERLLEEGIGAKIDVESAEQNYIVTHQERDQAAHALDLMPIRMDEAEREIELAKSRLETALFNLERTRVTAPFAGRIKSVEIEEGQYVSPGAPAVTLADDSALELPVQLDGREASKWLQFAEGDASDGWFGALAPVVCSVVWTESPEAVVFEGALDRVETFDPATRMLTVIIRIDPDTAFEAPSFPLVEGMFCRATIPGTDMENVIRLPKTAVTFDNTVYTSVESRLKTVPVKVARIDDDYAYVREGIAPGDKIVTTRLVNPLDHSLLEVVAPVGESM